MQNLGRGIALAVAAGMWLVAPMPAQQPAMPAHEPGAGMNMPGMQGMMEEMQGMMGEMMAVHAYAPAALLEKKAALVLTADQIRKLEGLAQEVAIAKQHAKTEHQTRHARIVEQFKLAKPDPTKVKVDGMEAMQDMAAAHGVALSAAARAKGLLTEQQRSQIDGAVAEQQKMHHGAGAGMKKGEGQDHLKH